jgi:hypothetical protein
MKFAEAKGGDRLQFGRTQIMVIKLKDPLFQKDGTEIKAIVSECASPIIGIEDDMDVMVFK